MKAFSNLGFLAGGFDMFNIEHLDLLQRAGVACDQLIVGVYTDELFERRGGEASVIPFEERLEIVRSMRPVAAAIGLDDDDPVKAWELIRFDTLYRPVTHRVTEIHSLDEQLPEFGVEVVRLEVGQRSASALPNLGIA